VKLFPCVVSLGGSDEMIYYGISLLLILEKTIMESGLSSFISFSGLLYESVRSRRLESAMIISPSAAACESAKAET